MKYLVDANVWLEAIAAGAHAADAVQLLQSAPPGSLAVTDFSLHTIGLVVTPREPLKFLEFLDDLIRRRVFTLHLTPTDLYTVVERMSSAHLDFDDAFQYVAAKRNDLRIVSFDADFDRSPRGRITPAQAASEIQSHRAGTEI
jgi:predicted nucleic acid-binding protein